MRRGRLDDVAEERTPKPTFGRTADMEESAGETKPSDRVGGHGGQRTSVRTGEGRAERVQRDGRTTGTAPGRAAAKGSQIGRSAAGRTGELGRAAATKGSEIGRSAAGKTGEFGRAAASKSAEIGRNMTRLDVPWARCRFARVLREAILDFALGPLMDLYTRPRAYGRERFRHLDPPVVFVANHSSHLDTPTILRALPREWRQRTAVAAAADYFYKKRATASFVALIFNTVPFARRGGGVGKGSTDHVDKLIDQRWNLLMFPEGTRSRDGKIGKLHSGAAVIAAQHDISIVPIFVRGTHDAMPPGRNWPRRIPGRFVSRRHRVAVHFGEPIRPQDAEHRNEVMERVRVFFESEAPAREQ